MATLMKASFGRILGFTAIETAALAIWLFLVMDGKGVAGAVVLFLGLLAEHIVASFGIPSNKRLIGVSASETVIWVVWLLLTNINPIIAAVFLFVGMFIQHNVELNVLALRDKIFDGLFNKRVALFTAFEVVGGTAWLALTRKIGSVELYGVAVLVLFALLLLEHKEQVKVLESGK